MLGVVTSLLDIPHIFFLSFGMGHPCKAAQCGVSESLLQPGISPALKVPWGPGRRLPAAPIGKSDLNHELSPREKATTSTCLSQTLEVRSQE